MQRMPFPNSFTKCKTTKKNSDHYQDYYLLNHAASTRTNHEYFYMHI